MPVAYDSPPSVLVIRLSSFGDILLAEPVARVLKSLYPSCRLGFAVSAPYAGLPALFSSVDRVVEYSKQDPGPWRDTLGQRYDLVIDLQANRHSRRIVAGMKAGKVLRYKRPRLGRFFTVYLPWLWKGAQPHTVKTYFRTLEPLGIRYRGEVPKVVPAAEGFAEARALVGDRPALGICPGSSSEHKSWGDERFRELVRLLGREYRILLVGSEKDGPAIERVRRGISGSDIVVYAGADVGAIASLLAVCKATVTNDSGLMHLAGAVGSRPVAIFGPTSPLLGFAPAAESAVVLSLGLSCSPCSYHGNKPCRLDRRYCMEGITPEHVASVVRGMMETP
jgi:heptosyltransferase-2